MARLASLWLLLATVFAVGARAPNASVETVPFIYEDARLYVPVRIAGGPVRWFILDTGATQTIIDTAVAREAGLAFSGSSVVDGVGAGSSLQSHASSVHLSVGPVPLSVVHPAVADLAHLLGPTSGRAPAGIIGSQFFREHFVDIDFQARRLTIFSPAAQRRSAYAVAVPVTFAEWTPLAPVRLTLPTGRTVIANALLDLGAKSTFLVPEPFIDREHLRAAFPRTVETGLGAGVGGDTFYAFGRADRLGFEGVGKAALDRPIVGLSVRGTLRSTWNDGLLGAEFLSRFRLGFDYPHSRLLLTQVSRDAAPFDRSGLFLGATGSDFLRIMVRSTISGGPAEAAGLLPGDELLTLDGKPVASLGLPSVREALKSRARSVTLGFRRGSEERTTRLQLRDLL